MKPKTYKSAGVDVEAYDAWLARLKSSLPAIGGFGGVLPLGGRLTQMNNPCLVAAADGVGTKTLVARAAGDFSTVGLDCVAMVINDLLCRGARPLFFLDYLAMGRFNKDEADRILEGVRRGCELVGCALLGGETSELPDLLKPGDFDLAGFGVGAVEQDKLIDGKEIRPGDAAIGLPSSGIHANGLSLARKALPDFRNDAALAGELLKPTRIYCADVLAALETVRVKGIAHITGGGLPDNLRRVLPDGVDAALDATTWETPAIFERIAKAGKVSEGEMFRTFNMGIGLCLVVGRDQTESCLHELSGAGARRIGEIVEGAGNVKIRSGNDSSR